MAFNKHFLKHGSIFAIFLHLSIVANASHLVGGDISVKWISGNNFEITVNVYRDCKNANTGAYLDRPIVVGIYDLVSNNIYRAIQIPLIDSAILVMGDGCNHISQDQICVQHGIYRTTATIDSNSNGYYISWLRCCRNGIIDNIADPGETGMVLYTEIPDPSLLNSTPTFGSYPNAYMCVAQENTKNFSATDPDNDSLVYSLVTALHGYGYTIFISAPSPPSPALYPDITWENPYSASDMIGGIPIISINSLTGILTANPSANDNGKVFVFVVRVEEYNRSTKQKLGEIRRDMQYVMLPCNVNLSPEFVSPTLNTYKIYATDSLCFDLKLNDPNTDDSVFFSATSEMFNALSGQPVVTFSPKKGVKSIQSHFCIQTYCHTIREAPYSITFNGYDSSCYGKNNISKTVDFYVHTIDGTLKDPIPNVFTPNGDTQNDFLKVNATANNCYDTFIIRIYDRWGDKVFESDDFLFAWDGAHYKTGESLPEGIYYYSLKGIFREQTVEKLSYIILLK